MEPQLIRSMSHDAALSVASSAFPVSANQRRLPHQKECMLKVDPYFGMPIRLLPGYIKNQGQENLLAVPGQTSLRRVELYHLEIRKD